MHRYESPLGYQDKSQESIRKHAGTHLATSVLVTCQTHRIQQLFLFPCGKSSPRSQLRLDFEIHNPLRQDNQGAFQSNASQDLSHEGQTICEKGYHSYRVSSLAQKFMGWLPMTTVLLTPIETGANPGDPGKAGTGEKAGDRDIVRGT